MIIDRYDPVNLFDLVPKLRVEMDAELSQLDSLLEDDVLFQRVRSDLVRRYPKTATHGRHSTPVEVILRLLVVKRLHDWSYEETEHFVSDSLVLRQFCHIYLESVPDDTTLIRWANLIGPGTVEQLNERVVELARSLKVTRGRKLRVDSTAVETNIHHPTDSGILGDGVRVLSRLLHRAKEVMGEGRELGQGAVSEPDSDCPRGGTATPSVGATQRGRSSRGDEGDLRQADRGGEGESCPGGTGPGGVAAAGGWSSKAAGEGLRALPAAGGPGHQSGEATGPERAVGAGQGEAAQPVRAPHPGDPAA